MPPRHNETTAVVRPETFEYRAEYDADNYPIYEGWAGTGQATSAAGWNICKHTYTNGNLVATSWAAGSTSFNQVWDDRSSLF